MGSAHIYIYFVLAASCSLVSQANAFESGTNTVPFL